MLPIPPRLVGQEGCSADDTLQFTLVDCPGHASLIRTIIGASRLFILVTHVAWLWNVPD
jgi:selenocysteine-specific elongation factor